MTVRNDLALYEQHATGWWDVSDRFFRSLRSVGEFHVTLIEREWAGAIEGARVADLGCGGGFLALALADLGAEVVGLERSPGSVRAAQAEARRRGSRARFLCGDLYVAPLDTADYDFVLMSDVLEHLEHPAAALREAARLLRPGGRLFLNTFDRTLVSAFTVVHLAEGLGLVPRGTHDARLFVRPDELRTYAAEAGLELERVVRERPALLRTIMHWKIHLIEASRGPGYSAFLTRRGS